ncbi:gluconokinase [Microbacterium sp.]|uniref:gluconokinase n=1 Tax=Microbacterium sp. TaxID=51671 RepID=UPI002733DF62|nr:gluconokinase [Microbacterium sp.]MDP3949367.1 gluconokinase [Microbacterium sp.]
MRLPAPAGPLVVVMGVSGCGKSTVGSALADRLRTLFRDADDLHPASNVDKMSRGIPLTDEDRSPWLAAVGEELARHRSTGLVIACSALKTVYRGILRSHAPEVFFLHLDASKQLLAERMVTRSEHFMPLSLLESQLRALEPLSADESGIKVNADLRVGRIVTLAERAVRAMHV